MRHNPYVPGSLDAVNNFESDVVVVFSSDIFYVFGKILYIDKLKAEMRKGLVRICHSVSFILLSHSSTFGLRHITQFTPQTYRHGFIISLPGSTDNPAHSQSCATIIAHLYKNLVGGTAHPHASNLQHGRCITQRCTKNLNRLFTGFLFNQLKGLV